MKHRYLTSRTNPVLAHARKVGVTVALNGLDWAPVVRWADATDAEIEHARRVLHRVAILHNNDLRGSGVS